MDAASRAAGGWASRRRPGRDELASRIFSLSHRPRFRSLLTTRSSAVAACSVRDSARYASLGLFRPVLCRFSSGFGLLLPRLGQFRPGLGLGRPRLGLSDSRLAAVHARVLLHGSIIRRAGWSPNAFALWAWRRKPMTLAQLIIGARRDLAECRDSDR